MWIRTDAYYCAAVGTMIMEWLHRVIYSPWSGAIVALGSIIVILLLARKERLP